MATNEDRERIAGLTSWLVQNYAEELRWFQSQGLVVCYYEGELFGKKWTPEVEEAFSREKVEARTHVCLLANIGDLYCKARFKITQVVSSPGGDA